MIFKLLIMAGMWVDLVSMARWLKKNKTGHGGGMPFLAMFIYAPLCWWHGSYVLLAGLSFFHYMCNFMIPVKHRRWLSSDRGLSLLE